MTQKSRGSSVRTKTFNDYKSNNATKISNQNKLDRMKLHALSQNNRYFLFEDSQEKILKVYILKNTNQDIEIFDNSIKQAYDHEEYEFVPIITIPLKDSLFIDQMKM